MILYLELEDLLQINKIYRVIPVHYLERQRKRHEKEQYNIEGEKRKWQPLLFAECSTC